MAYTIYFGYLPKSSLIVDRSTNIVVDTDLANLYNFEVSQISFTQNGGASFIIPQTQHKIDHMAFACYNAFFIKTMNYDDDGVYQGYSITTYDITNIAYSSATNVKITGILSPYNLAVSLNYNSNGFNKHMVWNNMHSFNTYVERGYKWDSIINSSQKVNFSSTGNTDIYCLPPFDLNKDIYKYSEKIKYKIADGTSDDTTINNYFENVLWEIAFLQTPATNDEGRNTIYERTTKVVNTGGKMEMPYLILCKPLNLSIDLGFKSGGAYYNWGTSYDNIINSFTSFVMAKQVTFLPPFKLGAGESITYDSVLDKYIINIIDTSEHVQQNLIYSHDAGDNPLYATIIRIKKTPYVFNGSVVLSNYETAGMITNPISKTYAPSDLANISTNPYINLITQEIRLSDNQGNSYTYPLINLGYFSQLNFNTYVSFDMGEMWTYTTIDTSYLSQSVMNTYYGKNYCGLLTRFNNCLLWNVDLLKDYMSQNRNFYLQREEIQKQTYRKFLQDMFFVTRSVATKNYGGAMSEFSSGISRLRDYDTSITLQDYGLDNLQYAPDKLQGQENDTLFYSNNRLLGIYVDFYTTRDVVKKAVWQDFIDYGMYINRVVDDTTAYEYMHLTNNMYDRKHLKFFKGNAKLKPFYIGETIGNKYVDNYLCLDSCIKKLEKNINDGCYILKDDGTIFKPYDSSSELQIFNDYISNDLFRGV